MLALLFVEVIVLSASRTGLLGMAVLMGWGLLDRRLSRAERLGRLDDPGEWRDVAIHGEHPVGDDQDEPPLPAPGSPGLAGLAQDLAERRHIGMWVDLARRLRQSHAVDDRGMVEGVRHDEVGLPGHRRDDPGVGGETRLEGQDRRGALELREFRLKGLVHRHRPGDRPDRTTPRSELAHGRRGRVAHPRVVGKAQVVVG